MKNVAEKGRKADGRRRAQEEKRAEYRKVVEARFDDGKKEGRLLPSYGLTNRMKGKMEKEPPRKDNTSIGDDLDVVRPSSLL